MSLCQAVLRSTWCEYRLCHVWHNLRETLTFNLLQPYSQEHSYDINQIHTVVLLKEGEHFAELDFDVKLFLIVDH